MRETLIDCQPVLRLEDAPDEIFGRRTDQFPDIGLSQGSCGELLLLELAAQVFFFFGLLGDRLNAGQAHDFPSIFRFKLIPAGTNRFDQVLVVLALEGELA